MRNHFMTQPATVLAVAEDLVRELGKQRAIALAQRCADTTYTFGMRAFWTWVADLAEQRGRE